MGRKITRSTRDKAIAGVCGGLAEYFNLDPTIVRLGFVIVAFFGGTGIIAYIIGAIVIPEDGEYTPLSDFYKDSTFEREYDKDKDFSEIMGDKIKEDQTDPGRNKTFIGICLILLGGMLFIREFFSWIDSKVFFPMILIVIGGFIIFRGRKKV